MANKNSFEFQPILNFRDCNNIYDLGTSSIHHIPNLDLLSKFKTFINDEVKKDDILTSYNFEYKNEKSIRTILCYFDSKFGLQNLNVSNITICNGAHNSIVNVLRAFLKLMSAKNISLFYQTPNYQYWKIAHSLGIKNIPLSNQVKSLAVSIKKNLDNNIPVVILDIPSAFNTQKINIQKIKALSSLINLYNGLLILDTTYQDLSDSSVKDLINFLPMDKTVIIYGASKSWGLAGLRLGFCLTLNEKISYRIRQEKAAESISNNSIGSLFFSYLIERYKNIPSLIKKELIKKENVAAKHLTCNSLLCKGLKFEKSNISLFGFIFFDNKELGITSEVLANYLNKEFNIKILPANRFFPNMELCSVDFIRISYGAEKNYLKSIKILKGALLKL